MQYVAIRRLRARRVIVASLPTACSQHVVACRYVSGQPVPAAQVAIACSGRKPEARIACEACAFCEDYAQHQDCSGNGVCTDGQCKCVAGASGAICDIAFDCESGVLTQAQTCCDSGVVDSMGACCVGSGTAVPSVDAAGVCCPIGRLDVCGECGGSGVAIDIAGVCCEVYEPSVSPGLAMSCASA